MARVKEESSGSGLSLPKEVVRRARVARNCSGRSDVGGGLKRFVSAGFGGLRLGGLLGSGSGFGGSLGEGSEGAKVVRVSEGWMRGKEAVEKM